VICELSDKWYMSTFFHPNNRALGYFFGVKRQPTYS
jgi:hypothetical protein